MSLSNMVFHCCASSGAGAWRRAGMAEKVWLKVLPDLRRQHCGHIAYKSFDSVLTSFIPARKAVLVRPTTCATRRPAGRLVMRMKAVSPIVSVACVQSVLDEMGGRKEGRFETQMD